MSAGVVRVKLVCVVPGCRWESGVFRADERGHLAADREFQRHMRAEHPGVVVPDCHVGRYTAHGGGCEHELR